MFYVGLVGEAWKAGVGLLGMALLADHSGLTHFSFGNQLPDERRMLLSFSLSANFEISYANGRDCIYDYLTSSTSFHSWMTGSREFPQ